MTDNTESPDDIRAKEAYRLYSQGRYPEAFAIYSDILRRNPDHYPSLQGYIEEMYRRKHIKEGVHVALRLLIQQGEENNGELNKRTGAVFAKLIAEPSGLSYILTLMQGNAATSNAEALDFLGKVAMDHGELNASLALRQVALNAKPDSALVMSHIIDANEVLMQTDKALLLAKQFLQNNPLLTVGGARAAAVLKAWETKKPQTIEVPDMSGRTDRLEATPYTLEELALIDLYYRIVKLLYLKGDREAVSAIVPTIKPAQIAGEELHLTHIRNGNSYFLYIEALLTVPIEPENLKLSESNRLYMMGDSHCLSLAWRTLTLKTPGEHKSPEKKVLMPFLINGCKIWHLRKESNFYPKVQFYQALKLLPKGATALFIFGEIDCREGIIYAMQKGLYTSLDEALSVVVDIYIDVLRSVATTKRLKRLYVHPVPPVLNETRSFVAIFNRILGSRLARLRKYEPHTVIRWFHIESEFLTLDRTTLLEELQFDGSHLHPRYGAILENTINVIESNP